MDQMLLTNVMFSLDNKIVISKRNKVMNHIEKKVGNI
jgi:hypothetical protein